MQLLRVGQLRKIDSFRLENAHQLFVGQDEIHVASQLLLHRFKLLCRARTDERDLAARVGMLNEPCRIDHRRVGHRNVAGFVRKQPARHHSPRRAARRRQKLLP